MAEYLWVTKHFLEGGDCQLEKDISKKGLFGKLFGRRKINTYYRNNIRCGLVLDLSTATELLLVLSGQKYEDMYAEYAIQGRLRDGKGYLLPEEILGILHVLLYVKGRSDMIFMDGEKQLLVALDKLIAFYTKAIELQMAVGVIWDND